MIRIIPIGIAAGAASALLFASVATGSLVAVLLFYLAPLPILIAAIGWSHLAGLIAAVVAGGALAFVFGGLFFLAFLVGIGLPAWWLGYLALLGRPVGDANAGTFGVEWYPVGGLVAWTAAIGAIVVVVAIVNFGLDADTFRAGLRQAFEQILRIQTQTPAGAPLTVPGLSDPNRLLDIMVAVVPAAAAVLTTVTNLINLWLAGRIVRISGRLARPWPELSAMTFPPAVPGILVAAVAGTFLPGIGGILATVLSASLLVAFGVLGLAVLHQISRRMGARPFLIAGTYAAVLMFGWPILLMAVLGLLDTVLNIRGRVAAGQPPSIPPT